MSDMYERRFRATAIAEGVMTGVPFFCDLTEREKSKISNRSVKMFTLSGIRSATESLLMGLKLESDERRIELASAFWTEVGQNIREWRMVKAGDVNAADLRRDYIHAHTLALAAIAHAAIRSCGRSRADGNPPSRSCAHWTGAAATPLSGRGAL